MRSGILWGIEVFFENKWQLVDDVWPTKKSALNCPHIKDLKIDGYKIRVVKYIREKK